MKDSFFDSLPGYANDYAASIAAQQQQALPAYHIEQRSLPAPLWVRRGLPDSGPQAWSVLKDELITAAPDDPICIYAHIPFCSDRCAFCDCYAFALKQHQTRHTGSYAAALGREIDIWAAQGFLSIRPVSTIHLGGGTPTMLGAQHLANLVETLRSRFYVDKHTEWALESTSSALDEEMFALLHQLGFTRLHIGVQSLQDEVRTAIGRRESATKVIAKIEKAISLGWIVSVDVIVGLPGQTPGGLLDDLDRLIDAGVEGFSVYELQHSSRNRRFVEKHNLHMQKPEQRYLLFQLVFQHLEAQGFSKNVFNHLAKGRDKNLYFTFPQRGEDLLALGAIADGVMGNYHYRHPEYLPYTQRISRQNPGLQGGLQRTPSESLMHYLEVEIMSGQIDPFIFNLVLGESKSNTLLQMWLTHGMLEEKPDSKKFSLTPNGAWFNGQLLQEAFRTAGEE